MTLSATLCLCLFGVACQANAAADLKGVSIGMTLKEAKTAVPNFVCRSVPAEPPRVFDQACSATGTYAGVSADVYISVAKNRVGRVMVSGANQDWARIREGLIAKYGKPARVEKSVMTTIMGVKIPTETLHWSFGDDQSIEAARHIDARHFGVGLDSRAIEAEERRVAGPPEKDM